MNRDRERKVLQLIRDFLANEPIKAPLSLAELRFFATKLYLLEPEVSLEWIMIMLNNELWRPIISRIPAEKILLLLPQCLRNATLCKAEVDEFGLLCEQCGECCIGELQQEAEELGMLAVVAEGSPIVWRIIEDGMADGIIGVSCMDSLKKAFDHMVDNAIVGIGIPLDCDGCVNTTVDVELLREWLHLRSEEKLEFLDLKSLEQEVKSCFELDNLNSVMGEVSTLPEKISREYLSANGKRFRPFLVVAVYQALTNKNEISLLLKKIAIAVECFHKASLIHDDIEDEDKMRDGEVTLHEKEGVAVAINCGDLLLGEGYRLISECFSLDSTLDHTGLLRTAALGHINLCCGQGNELSFSRTGACYSVETIINIFRAKTAPAFDVALVLGALVAKAESSLCGVLKEFSSRLGVAYQIYDDISDFVDGTDSSSGRLSIMAALAYEEMDDERSLEEVWRSMNRERTYEQGVKLYERYRNETFELLRDVDNFELKRLLFRVSRKILKDV